MLPKSIEFMKIHYKYLIKDYYQFFIILRLATLMHFIQNQKILNKKMFTAKRCY